MEIELNIPETEITGKDISVETGNTNIAVLEDTKDLDITYNRKEYSIIGDGIFISSVLEDVPEWLGNLIDSTFEAAILSRDQNLINRMEAILTAMDYVPKNQYTEQINQIVDEDGIINTRIATLNSNLTDAINTANATIAEIDLTYASKDEASAIATNVITASLSADGEIGSTLIELQNAYADLESTTAESIILLESIMEGEINGNASAMETIRSYVGIDEAGASTGTGLSAYLEDSNGVIGGADSQLNNTIKVTAEEIESKFAYNSVVNINGVYKKSGFGLTTNYTSGNGTEANPYVSEFWIDASRLRFTNSNVTGQTAPFTIDATGTTPQITFNGKVTFSNISDSATYIPTISSVTAAQTTANTAVTNAATANTLLADIASDSKLTPDEKISTKKELDIIVSEYSKNTAQANTYSVSSSTYTTSYNSLSSYITPLLSSLSTTSTIVGTTFRTNFKNYYDARTDLLNAIATKISTNATAYANGVATAQTNYTNTVKQALIDGEISTAEANAIATAKKVIVTASGLVPAYGSATVSNISYDTDEDAFVLYSSSDSSIGAAYPAFRVSSSSNETFKISLSVKASAASSSGLYFGICEYDSELPDGKTHVSNGASASASVVQEDTRIKWLGANNGAITTDWVTKNFEYVPTSTAKWASIVILNWTDMGTAKLYFKGLQNISSPTISWQSEVQAAINNNATTIDGAKITTGTVDAARLNVNQLNALNITAGSVAAEHITGSIITGKLISASTFEASYLDFGNGFKLLTAYHIAVSTYNANPSMYTDAILRTGYTSYRIPTFPKVTEESKSETLGYNQSLYGRISSYNTANTGNFYKARLARPLVATVSSARMVYTNALFTGDTKSASSAAITDGRSIDFSIYFGSAEILRCYSSDGSIRSATINSSYIYVYTPYKSNSNISLPSGSLSGSSYGNVVTRTDNVFATIDTGVFKFSVSASRTLSGYGQGGDDNQYLYTDIGKSISLTLMANSVYLPFDWTTGKISIKNNRSNTTVTASFSIGVYVDNMQ